MGKGWKVGLAAVCLLGAMVVFAMTREPAKEDYSMEPVTTEPVEEKAEKEWDEKAKKKKEAVPSKRIRENIG